MLRSRLTPGNNVEELEDLVPEVDREYLTGKGYKFSASRVGADVHVAIQHFSLPAAYLPRTVTLLIILPAGYPNANLDMFYTSPNVSLARGGVPVNCSAINHVGVPWQQWSRHFATAWRQGTDDLRSFLASVRHELNKGI